ncbi:EcsC family protein [Caldalkalibacillus salinus]|uniref:EcsC family protein n=1 Tax=Caldalkalibacillus salinus TaxID=2803787 RepID=UPI00192459BD|nr:EcsC family protein [Caldalkalibacillus salinus]
METYDRVVQMQLMKFERELYDTTEWQQMSKSLQEKLDGLVPRKIHRAFAQALEKAVKSFLQGLNLLPSRAISAPLISDERDLRERTEKARPIIQKYQRLASIEGAGTGFGGIISSGIDFPALISIKLRLLQELMTLFGYRLENFEERLYTLNIFLLPFSGIEVKREVWQRLKTWENQVEFNEWDSWDTFDWEGFYLEYKQSIEFRKLLQMIPGLGAIVGAWANYTLVEELGTTALKCLQLRHLQQTYQHPIL